MTLSGPRVALLGERFAERAAELAAALPPGWSVTDGDGGLAAADYLVVCDGAADDALLARAERLRGVVRLAEGDAAVDEEACARRGIAIGSVESSTTISVAEHAVTAILVLLKRIPQASEQLRAGVVVGDAEPAVTTQASYAYNWVGLPRWETLHGQTVGLVGLGDIAAVVARRLRAFGADVIYTKPTRADPAREAELGVRYAPFEELLAGARCVSLHNRHTSETEGMMGAREFAAMPPGSFFVNTARGGLVDEDALAAALASGQLAGAALDVFRLEPLPPDSPLLRAPNLLLTPHVAGIPVAESERIAFRRAAQLLAGGLGR